MDYRTFLASLDREERISLTRRRNAPGLVHLAGHLGLIFGLGLWVAWSWPLWPVALVFLGIAQIFLFTLEHECSHKTAFRSQWINTYAGRLAGLVVLVPFEWFAKFHHEHHRFTQDPDRDPELEGGKPQTWAALLLHLSGLPMWRALVVQLWRDARGKPGVVYIAPDAVRTIQIEAWATITIYALVGLSLFWSPGAFWYWILPILIGQPFLRFYLLAEHGACPMVPDMFANSRTTLTTSLVRFLAWNMPYHAEHHAYPAVPFWRLPDLHRLAHDHIGTKTPGYGRFAKDYVGAMKGGRS